MAKPNVTPDSESSIKLKWMDKNVVVDEKVGIVEDIYPTYGGWELSVVFEDGSHEWVSEFDVVLY